MSPAQRRSRRRAATAILALAAGLVVLGGAQPASAATIYSGPLAASLNYLTPDVTIAPGETLTYSNFDLVANHDVTSRDLYRPKPKCKIVKRKGKRRRKCTRPTPELLFQSELIGFGESSTVRGTERLKSGRTYEYFCSIHPSMTGTVSVR